MRSPTVNLIPSIFATLFGFLILPSTAQASIGPENVLVVVNDESAISLAIGAYYASLRGLPPENVFHLPLGTSSSETISRSTYNEQIRDPLIEYLSIIRPELRERIYYVVLTKGVPHRVSNSGGSGIGQSAASVDSELTQLWTGLVPDEGHQGRLFNPYFEIPGSFMTYRDSGVAGSENVSYLVFRLDGYQTNPDPISGVPEDIKRLIDDAQNPTEDGLYVLDATGASGQGNDWMGEANQLLTDLGKSISYDTDPGTFLRNQNDILAYCSWGSNDPSDPGPPYYGEIPVGSGMVYPGTFVPGALATTYVSTSARTFLDGQQNYGQSLIADLVHLGVAAVNGHVFEPFLDAVSRPHLVFRSYTEGCTVGDAFYQSIAYLSWENVIICDPLMRKGNPQGLPPVIDSITPNDGGYVGGTEISIRGDGFRVGDTVITLDNAIVDSTIVHSRDRLSFVLPPNDPGSVDLELSTSFGSELRPGGILYTPAMTLEGTPDLGATITINIFGEVVESYVLMMSLDSSCVPLPPFGKLLIDPNAGFLVVGSGFMLLGRETLMGTIPDDPALSGVTLFLQSLVGRDFGAGLGYLSNRLDLVIP